MTKIEFTPTDFHPILTPDANFPLTLYGCQKGLQTIYELGESQVQIAYELALGIPRETILNINNRKPRSINTHISEIYEKLYIPGIQRMIMPTLIMNGLVQSVETSNQLFTVPFYRYEPQLPNRHIQVDEDTLIKEFGIHQDSAKTFALAIIGTQLSEICRITKHSEANVLKRLSQTYQQGITLENGLAICLMRDFARLVTSPTQSN